MIVRLVPIRAHRGGNRHHLAGVGADHGRGCDTRVAHTEVRAVKRPTLLLLAVAMFWALGCTLHVNLWGKYYGDTDNETQGIQDVHRDSGGYTLDTGQDVEAGPDDR